MLFFFFKQKTAYEMRISYWSSDVCSSDLWSSGISPNVAGAGLDLLATLRESRKHIICLIEGLEELYEITSDPTLSPMLRAILIDLPIKLRSEPGRPLGLVVLARRDSIKIGRASCRERVGQYV